MVSSAVSLSFWIAPLGRPSRLEHLEGGATQEDRVAVAHQAGDVLTHFGVEPEARSPCGVVDDAVEGHELVHLDRAHVAAPLLGGRWSRRVDVRAAGQSSLPRAIRAGQTSD